MSINRSPLKAIRAKCLSCSNGQHKEVRLCPVKNCPLWPFRSGHRLPKETVEGDNAEEKNLENSRITDESGDYEEEDD